MSSWDGAGLTATLLVYLTTVIVAARSIRDETDLSDREKRWGTALVLVPLAGLMLWVVVGPDRAWRIFSRSRRRSAPTAPASRQADR